MGLLQDPMRVVEQIDWHLLNGNLEKFPGAFVLAAGNLSRQLLEQILFILCFYSGMPRNSYLRSDSTLQTAGRLLKVLDQQPLVSARPYWQLARERGPRISKFARQPRTLKKWQRLLNEPSHYSAGYRRVDAISIKEFVDQVRNWFDDKDKHLTLSAVNELYSRGKIKAILGDDRENTPGIAWRITVTAANLEIDAAGQLSLRGPKGNLYVVSNSEIPKGPWPGAPLLVQGYDGFVIQQQFVTKRGNPVNLASFEAILMSFAQTPGERAYLTRRLRELGVEVRYRS